MVTSLIVQQYKVKLFKKVKSSHETNRNKTKKEINTTRVLGRSTCRRDDTSSNRGSDDLIAAHSADINTDEAAERLTKVSRGLPKYFAVGT